MIRHLKRKEKKNNKVLRTQWRTMLFKLQTANKKDQNKPTSDVLRLPIVDW